MTIDEALAHEFVAQVRDPGREPACRMEFVFGHEEYEKDVSALKTMLSEEVSAFQVERCGGYSEPWPN